MLTADIDAPLSHLPDGFGIASQCFEHGLKIGMESKNRGVTGIDGAPPRVVKDFARLFNFADKPICVSKAHCRPSPRIEGKSELCLVVTLWIVNSNCALQV